MINSKLIDNFIIKANDVQENGNSSTTISANKERNKFEGINVNNLMTNKPKNDDIAENNANVMFLNNLTNTMDIEKSIIPHKVNNEFEDRDEYDSFLNEQSLLRALDFDEEKKRQYSNSPNERNKRLEEENRKLKEENNLLRIQRDTMAKETNRDQSNSNENNTVSEKEIAHKRPVVLPAENRNVVETKPQVQNTIIRQPVIISNVVQMQSPQEDDRQQKQASAIQVVRPAAPDMPKKNTHSPTIENLKHKDEVQIGDGSPKTPHKPKMEVIPEVLSNFQVAPQVIVKSQIPSLTNIADIQDINQDKGYKPKSDNSITIQKDRPRSPSPIVMKRSVIVQEAPAPMPPKSTYIVRRNSQEPNHAQANAMKKENNNESSKKLQNMLFNKASENTY